MLAEGKCESTRVERLPEASPLVHAVAVRMNLGKSVVKEIIQVIRETYS